MKPTRKQPLFCVTGASCVGKSSACEVLFRNEEDYIVLESDILWNDVYNTPEDDYRVYRGVWMNICAAVSQSGKPCVLCGCCTPQQFERLPEREMFTEIHYLALVCDDESMLGRMKEGRGVTDEGWIASSLHFNRWLRENADSTEPPITLLDTTHITAQEAAQQIDAWIKSKLCGGNQI